MHSWKQCHANESNQGIMPINTIPIAKPKWTIEVGKVGYCSPVISADGVVYIGLLQGELVAVNPDGSIKWKREVTTEGNPDFPGVITASPAVDNDGDIYVITTINAILKDRRTDPLRSIQVRRSSLHSFTPAGNRRWSYRFPVNPSISDLGGYTASSPKIWGKQNVFIFVPAFYTGQTHKVEILVFNQSGNLVNKTGVSSYSDSSMTTNNTHLLNEIKSAWDFMGNHADFDAFITKNTYERIAGWPEATLAIVDDDPHQHQPIILIEDNYKTLAAYRWNFPLLAPLWFKRSEKVRQHTSPAVFTKGRIISGGKDGLVDYFDLENGGEVCRPSCQTDGVILSPPVWHDGLTYCVSGQQLLALDESSSVKYKYAFSGKCMGSVALSSNHVYLSSDDGFYIFSLDLTLLDKNMDVVGGVSTPSISQDGTVYVMDQKGKLWAFGE